MRILRCIAFVGIIIGLIGCASTSSDRTTSAPYGSGLGERDQVEALDMNASYTTVAPRDQLYYFPYDNSGVSQKYVASIESQAHYLAANPGARVLLTGHTDARGSREYNVALGERRAQSVVDILRLNGAAVNQIRIVSYGKERPQVRGDDESAYQYNRRVELIYEATK